MSMIQGLTKFIGPKIQISVCYYQFILTCPYDMSKIQVMTKFIGPKIQISIYYY